MKNKRFLISVSLLFVLAISACNMPIFGNDSNLGATSSAEIQADTEPSTEAAQNEQPQAPTETMTPTEIPSAPVSGWVAFTGYDGNIWLVERGSGETKQITDDAVPFQPNSSEQTISYCCMQWSSDGALLAYQRETGTPQSWGVLAETSLWVYDLTGNANRQLLADTRVVGFAWKPGTHIIAYAPPIPEGYFVSRETQDAELALGIWAVDADSGSQYEIVPPERGYALVNPQWSPDTQKLGFEEVHYMEGRGPFAFYDFDAQQYFTWEETIGSYSWSPDGATLVYDHIDYTAQGMEQIWVNDFENTTEQPLSPVYTPGYAFRPVFSPDGSQVAYLVNLSGEEMLQINLYTIPVSGGNPLNLGTFAQFWEYSWTSDSAYLIFSAGPPEQTQVIEVSVSDGAIRVLANGRFAMPQP